MSGVRVSVFRRPEFLSLVGPLLLFQLLLIGIVVFRMSCLHLFSMSTVIFHVSTLRLWGDILLLSLYFLRFGLYRIWSDVCRSHDKII